MTLPIIFPAKKEAIRKLKCKKCGVNEVDGRKRRICEDCVRKDEEERKAKEIERQLERQRIERLLKKIVKPKAIKKAIWESQFTRRQLIEAACFKMMYTDTYNWDMKNRKDGIYSLHLLLETTTLKQEFFWELQRMVEKVVDDMYLKMRDF